MKKSQHQHLKVVLKSLPYKYYKVIDIYNYCNKIALDSKKYAKIIDSPDQIIHYVLKKTDTLKGKESWNYTIIDGEFCISYIKPISKHNIPYKVAMDVLL